MLGRAGWTRSGLGLTFRATKGPSKSLDLQEHGHSQQEDFPSWPTFPSLEPSLLSRNALGHQAGHPKQPPPTSSGMISTGLKGTCFTLGTQPRRAPAPGYSLSSRI